MTDEEKISLIDSLENRDETEENFAILQCFSYDPDAFVRSRCAAVLVNYSGDESLRTLLRLANDTDSFVRTEAYDSLAVFPCRETELLLRHCIYPEDDALAAGYAILSWADVTAALHNEYDMQIAFVHQLLNDTEFSDCHAECFYAMCKFGESGALEQLLSLLDDPDYAVQCSICNFCKDLANVKNAAIIRKAISAHITTETEHCVISAMQNLLAYLETIH